MSKKGTGRSISFAPAEPKSGKFQIHGVDVTILRISNEICIYQPSETRIKIPLYLSARIVKDPQEIAMKIASGILNFDQSATVKELSKIYKINLIKTGWFGSKSEFNIGCPDPDDPSSKKIKIKKKWWDSDDQYEKLLYNEYYHALLTLDMYEKTHNSAVLKVLFTDLNIFGRVMFFDIVQKCSKSIQKLIVSKIAGYVTDKLMMTDSASDKSGATNEEVLNACIKPVFDQFSIKCEEIDGLGLVHSSDSDSSDSDSDSSDSGSGSSDSGSGSDDDSPPPLVSSRIHFKKYYSDDDSSPPPVSSSISRNKLALKTIIEDGEESEVSTEETAISQEHSSVLGEVF